jgi:putative aldouronate transport system permease protein
VLIFRQPANYRPFANSVFITIVGTTLAMIVNSVGAYALSKRELPGNKFFIYFLIIIPMLISGGMIPGYLLIRSLGLIDKIAVLIIPALASGWNMILIRNYYWSIPNSLVESARIDGAEEFTVFAKIILPLIKAGACSHSAVYRGWLLEHLLLSHYIHKDNHQVYLPCKAP